MHSSITVDKCQHWLFGPFYMLGKANSRFLFHPDWSLFRHLTGTGYLILNELIVRKNNTSIFSGIGFFFNAFQSAGINETMLTRSRLVLARNQQTVDRGLYRNKNKGSDWLSTEGKLRPESLKWTGLLVGESLDHACWVVIGIRMLRPSDWRRKFICSIQIGKATHTLFPPHKKCKMLY